MWYHYIILAIGLAWAAFAIYGDFIAKSPMKTTTTVIVIRGIIWLIILGIIYWGYSGITAPPPPTFGGRRRW